jgi:hypothetical protein
VGSPQLQVKDGCRVLIGIVMPAYKKHIDLEASTKADNTILINKRLV